LEFQLAGPNFLSRFSVCFGRLRAVKFSIITPSFNQSHWLKLCVASIADQQGVELEHIVQDAGSTDGTQDWLAKDSRVKTVVEKDGGMYDAINRGFRKASGDMVAYLNCDEQYLPGALKAVEETFARHPDADIVLADSVVVDEQGQFICCRKSLVPYRLWAWTYMPTLTSSIFIRRRVLDDFNLYFDIRWKILGDAVWMKEAMSLRLKMVVLRRYTSIFTETGENLWLKPTHLRERQLAVRMMPWWVRWFRWPLMQAHRVRAVCNRLYWENPFTYSLYTLANPERRTEIFVPKPTGIWWRRHEHAKLLKPL
jgi:glycosyltransferase involved in cell wall biosynthesis